MKNLIRFGFLGAIIGIVQSMANLSAAHSVSLSDVVFGVSLEGSKITIFQLIFLIISMFPYIVFQILAGVHIYKHFCTASVYCFSRRDNRIGWFLHESLRLYLYAVAYLLFLVLGAAGVAGVSVGVTFHMRDWILLLYYLVLYSAFLYVTALMVNLLALFMDSGQSMFIIVIAQFAFVAFLLVYVKLIPLKKLHTLLTTGIGFLINPIANLVIQWHSSVIPTIGSRINLYHLSFDLNFSLLFYIVIAVCITFIGCITIKKRDIIVTDTEGDS